MNVFVSSQRVDLPLVQSFLRQLQLAGVAVECSPRNPLDGTDCRWNGWYKDGLSTAIEWADVFVVAVDYAWDSSTWMSEEAHAATIAGLPMYYWNPEAIQLRDGGMRAYLKVELPKEPADAVRLLHERHTP